MISSESVSWFQALFVTSAAPTVRRGRGANVKPIVHATYPLAGAASAYAALAAGGFTGKIVLLP